MIRQYSDALFRIIYLQFIDLCDPILKNKILNFNGLWPFLYYKGSNSLKSSTPYIDNSIVINEEDIEKLSSTVVDCDYGSLGFLELLHLTGRRVKL